MTESKHPNAQSYVESLQASGRYTFTVDGAAAALVNGAGLAVQAGLRRLKKKGRIASPRRGFFVVVPAEYRSAGSPPASWFIEDLMAFLGRSYYVGLLTAAAIHGASHQQPQAFQVVTEIPIRPMETGRVRIEFHRNRGVADVPVDRVKTETGTMRVSTPEATAMDLVRYPDASGGLGNVVTVLSELAPKIDSDRLRDLAAEANRSDVKRLGYLLDRVGLPELADPLAALAARWRKKAVLLRPDKESDGLSPDPRWQIIPNEEVEAEE